MKGGFIRFIQIRALGDCIGLYSFSSPFSKGGVVFYIFPKKHPCSLPPIFCILDKILGA
jgi:hypothetical protein